MRRIQKLIQLLKEEIALVDQTKIDKLYLESEEGYDLFRKMFITTLETMNENKIQLYARILVRSAILENANSDIIQKILFHYY